MAGIITGGILLLLVLLVGLIWVLGSRAKARLEIVVSKESALAVALLYAESLITVDTAPLYGAVFWEF